MTKPETQTPQVFQQKTVILMCKNADFGKLGFWKTLRKTVQAISSEKGVEIEVWQDSSSIALDVVRRFAEREKSACLRIFKELEKKENIFFIAAGLIIPVLQNVPSALKHLPSRDQEVPCMKIRRKNKEDFKDFNPAKTLFLLSQTVLEVVTASGEEEAHSAESKKAIRLLEGEAAQIPVNRMLFFALKSLEEEFHSSKGSSMGCIFDFSDYYDKQKNELPTFVHSFVKEMLELSPSDAFKLRQHWTDFYLKRAIEKIPAVINLPSASFEERFYENCKNTLEEIYDLVNDYFKCYESIFGEKYRELIIKTSAPYPQGSDFLSICDELKKQSACTNNSREMPSTSLANVHSKPEESSRTTPRGKHSFRDLPSKLENPGLRPSLTF